MKNFYLLYQPYMEITPQLVEQKGNAITPQLVEQIKNDFSPFLFCGLRDKCYLCPQKTPIPNEKNT